MFKKITAYGAHAAVNKFSQAGHKQFKSALKSPETVQRAKLNQILSAVADTDSGISLGIQKGMSWEQYADRLPVSDYNGWSALISAQQQDGRLRLSSSPCARYQPTSGSTSKIKWIPYTQCFLDELDQAISPWMADLYQRFPGIRHGKHYWSLSWVPTSMRTRDNESLNDDLKLLPWWKRIFMASSKAVPDAVAMAETSEDSLFASLCCLLSARDLSFLSVWSPTFALTLLEGLSGHREEIIQILRSGHWGSRAPRLSAVPCPRSPYVADMLNEWDGALHSDFTAQLWPKLTLLSAWDTSTSAIWARQLQQLFPQSAFQGKGLWATEGVVTIPFAGQYPLALTSHFYEFQDFETDRIHPAWDLKAGQVVRPLLTTGSGLLRYGLKDKLNVVSYLDACPCFEFLGRMDGVDMVGEKLSPEIAMELINLFDQSSYRDAGIYPMSLLAIPQQSTEQVQPNQKPSLPYYVLLCETKDASHQPVPSKLQLKEKIRAVLESRLQENFHYRLARELNQLSHAEVYCAPDARSIYQQRGTERGMITGNIKIEPLVLWDGNYSFNCHSGTSPKVLPTATTLEEV
ncbi:GH3 auxin-responsive promoter [Oleiphilus messinensis]|uniref:GH3 auxin-responsive promoter n=1 Tax=Oleiphilus messinensis TaxID=141451 RepID=A0A1Y0ICB2_9GAMM|nr:GH3 auxin-responsive promoter family protein [Oleiphilus messinensis]ARU57416.1 GH3 auxin-responsive promoter [Oleiphilus messinensis]